MNKEINWDNYPIGTKFKAKIKGNETEGRISKMAGTIYLCQNDFEGSECRHQLRYRYSWSIINGTIENLTRRNIEVTDLTLELDPIYSENIKLVVIDNGIAKIDNLHICYIERNPFGNCQNLSIKDFQNVYKAFKNKPGVLHSLFLELCHVKRFAVLDMRQDKLDALPKDESLYIFKTNYINTNQTPMCICGIENSILADYYKNLKD